MMEKTICSDLKEVYDNLADDYLGAFVGLSGIQDFEPFWVADIRGTVACVGDYFIGYDDLRTFVDNGVSFETFDEWYNYCTDVGMIDDSISVPTLEKWIGDYEPQISKDRIEYLSKLKKAFKEEVEKTKKE